MGNGSPPRHWSPLAIELMVTGFARSQAFWTGPMGFRVVYKRPEQKFCYIEHPDGAQLMFYERDGDWETGPLEVPFGRGAILQVGVADVNAAAASITAAGIPFYVPLREKWRDWGDRLGGQREFLVQDPDGYLVMISQKLGERPFPRT